MTWQRIDDDTFIDDTLVTCAEYQLFIDEMREQGKYYQPDHWTSYQFPEGQAKKPILGIRFSDAVAFCDWLNKKEKDEFKYRLPLENENAGQMSKQNLGYWIEGHEKHLVIDLYNSTRAERSISIDLLRNDLFLFETLRHENEQVKIHPPTSTELLDRSPIIPGGKTIFSKYFGNPELKDQSFARQIVNRVKNRYDLKSTDDVIFQEEINRAKYRARKQFEGYSSVLESFDIDSNNLFLLNLDISKNANNSIIKACEDAQIVFDGFDLIISLEDFSSILDQFAGLNQNRYRLVVDIHKSINLMIDRNYLNHLNNSQSIGEQYEILRWYLRVSAYLFTEQVYLIERYRNLLSKALNGFAKLYNNLSILEKIIESKFTMVGGIRLVKERIK